MRCEICHFDPDTGEDQRHATRSHEDCEAACYDCLLSYSNQREHAILDRQNYPGSALRCAGSIEHRASPTGERARAISSACCASASPISNVSGSTIWQTGTAFTRCGAGVLRGVRRPAVISSTAVSYAVIYVDGSHHDYPERQAARSPPDGLPGR